MKTFKLSIGVLLLLITSAIIFNSCRKYDASSETELENTKGYSYFRATMSKDKNIQAMYTEIKKVTWLISYRAYSNHKLSTSNSKESKMTRSSIKQKSLNLLQESKDVKTENQLRLFQSKLGFGADGDAIVSGLTNQKNHLSKFMDQNPEFRLLDKEQQKELILNAYKEIKLERKKIIIPSQEKTPEQCYADYEQGFDEAEFWFAAELIGFSLALIGCIYGSAAIGTLVCGEIYSMAIIGAEVQYYLTLLHLEVLLNECLGNVEPTSLNKQLTF